MIPVPIGSQLVKNIGKEDPEDLNDFQVFVISDSNVTGLALSDFSFTLAVDGSSADISKYVMLRSLEGQNSVYVLTVRPPGAQNFPSGRFSAVITLQLAKNAVSEGNPVTTQTIRVSTRFPDADAETFTLERQFTGKGSSGIAVSSESIFLLGADTSGGEPPYTSYTYVSEYSHKGVLKRTIGNSPSHIPYQSFLSCLHDINGELIIGNPQNGGSAILKNSVANVPEVRSIYQSQTRAITHTPSGILVFKNSVIQLLPFSENTSEIVTLTKEDFSGTGHGAVYDQGYIYYWTGSKYSVLELIDGNKIRRVRDVNIAKGNNNIRNDISLYRDHIYGFFRNASTINLYILDIRPYRPLAKNTKTTLSPVFATNGETIDLKRFCPDAKKIIFSLGFDKPSFLSINAQNEIRIPNGAVTKITTVLVKCTGINFIDAIDFEFYLVIRPKAKPTVLDIDEMSMLAGSSFDLFQIVKNAKTITFTTGKTQPQGVRIANGVFTIATVGGTAYFTATHNTGSTHFQITFHVVQTDRDLEDFSQTARHRVEIQSTDVTPDLREIASISESLDAVSLDKDRVNNTTVVLKNAGGKYNDAIPGNFWQHNNFNPAGYQEGINIFKEYLINGRWVSHLIFSGRISKTTQSSDGTTVSLTCVDNTDDLKNKIIEDFGRREKWGVLHPKSDPADYQVVSVPEASLLPIQPETGKAWRDQTALTRQQTTLPSEGPPETDTGHLTAAALHTPHDTAADDILLNFKTQPRSEDIVSLGEQLGIQGGGLQVVFDVDTPQLENPYILNRGSVAFSVEENRITRLPVDWVSDATKKRILILLSNPEAHLCDLLVAYDLQRNTYKVLHTLGKDVKVHRIARRNSTNVYILTSGAISQDRSDPTQLPRVTDTTAYAYDSRAHGSEIKIYHYNTSTDTLTEHVDEDDNYPPQLGIYYPVGFENGIYTNEFEGIRSEYRGPFKQVGSHLYYRYAKDAEFGVARVNASATTQRVMRQTNIANYNHLNFAFDVLSNETVYFVDCYKRNETFSVVDTGLPNGASRSLRLSNNLSGIAASQQLFIQVTVSRTDLRGDTRGRITGIDENGNTVSESFGQAGRGNGAYSGVSKHNYRRITSVTGGGSHAGARVKITNIIGDVTTLEIRRRTSAGVETTLFSQATLFKDTTEIPPVESTLIGVHEAIFHNNFLYFLAIVARLKDNNGSLYLDRSRSAGMRLYRCNVTATKPTLTLIDTWDFVTHAACNLTVHNGAVHYTEHPRAATAFKPINPDL